MSCTEIAPGVHEVCSDLGSRSVRQWICIGERVAVVDTGIAGDTVPNHLLPALARLEVERVDELLITHADVDHYGGNGELAAVFPEAARRAHPLDAPLISSYAGIASERYGWYRRHALDYPPEAWEFIEAAAGTDTSVDGSLEDGTIVELGGTSLETIHLPGHSAGHVGFLVRDTGLALIADAAQARGFWSRDGRLVGPPAIGDASGYRTSAARLERLELETLATSHFPLLRGDAVMRFLGETTAFMDELDTEIDRALVDGPVTVATLLPRCDAALGPYEELTLELARPIGAILEEREQHGQVRLTTNHPPTWSAP